MAGMGLRRVRITGGEPLVRRDLPELVAMLSAVPGIEDLSLSTNAVLLAEQADALRAAGVHRLNVSLDSLRPDRVDAIARRPGSYPKIMDGLRAAEEAGFAPIKINVVLIRGQNDDEIEDFAEITRERPWHVRFIELMPTGANLDLSAQSFVSCRRRFGAFGRSRRSSPSTGRSGTDRPRYYRFPGAPGTIGVITPMSHNYCDRCNRMRLTADGQLRPCLFGSLQTNLRDPLRAGDDIWRRSSSRPCRSSRSDTHLVQGSSVGSGGLVALSQTGG